MMADDFEKSHKQFKDHHKNWSTKLTTISDTIMFQEEYLCSKAVDESKKNAMRAIKRREVNTLVNEIHFHSNAVRIESTFLVEKRPWITIHDIRRMREWLHISSKDFPYAFTWSKTPIY